MNKPLGLVIDAPLVDDDDAARDAAWPTPAPAPVPVTADLVAYRRAWRAAVARDGLTISLALTAA